MIFDFYGTLIASTSPERWREHATDIADALGASPTSLLAALDATYGDRIRGRTGDAEATMRLLAAMIGSEADDCAIRAAVERRRRIHSTLFVLRPGMESALAALRHRGFELGLMSDCTDELPEVWPRLSIARLFRGTTFSYDEGRRKPDPALYRSTLDQLGVSAGNCIYVGDGAGNELAGAELIGMQAVLMDTDALDGQPPPLPSGTQWSGPRCTSMTELADQIAGLFDARASSGSGGSDRTR